MWMYPNGVVTKELCPNCDNPEPVECRHGHNDFGPVHDYDCSECGGCMSIVGYDCPSCSEKQSNTGLQSDEATGCAHRTPRVIDENTLLCDDCGKTLRR